VLDHLRIQLAQAMTRTRQL